MLVINTQLISVYLIFYMVLNLIHTYIIQRFVSVFKNVFLKSYKEHDELKNAARSPFNYFVSPSNFKNAALIYCLKMSRNLTLKFGLSVMWGYCKIICCCVGYSHLVSDIFQFYLIYLSSIIFS